MFHGGDYYRLASYGENGEYDALMSVSKDSGQRRRCCRRSRSGGCSTACPGRTARRRWRSSPAAGGAHPDYALQIPGRPPMLSRTQLVLDLSRKEVRDCIYDQLRKVLSSANIGVSVSRHPNQPSSNTSISMPLPAAVRAMSRSFSVSNLK